MAGEMLSTRCYKRRNVLNGDDEGHVLIGGDLEDGWLRWGEEDKDCRGQGFPGGMGC